MEVVRVVLENAGNILLLMYLIYICSLVSDGLVSLYYHIKHYRKKEKEINNGFSE